VLRTYEALFIVRPDLKDEEIQAVAKEVESLITNQGGAIVRSEIWGRRKLAYKVKQFTDGCYVLIRFQSPPSFISRLEGYFRISETIIRHLVVYFDEKTLRLEAEQLARREAELRAGMAPRASSDDDEDEDIDVPLARSRVALADYEDDEDDEEEEE
jgi:small subunit ribosomal protein S6